MNFGSHLRASRNEHAVEHAVGSMYCPQFCLHPEPVLWLQASFALFAHVAEHFPMHAATGSSAGLLSGMIMTSGSLRGKTFSGIHCGG
jgi:hypothetical protein